MNEEMYSQLLAVHFPTYLFHSVNFVRSTLLQRCRRVEVRELSSASAIAIALSPRPLLKVRYRTLGI